MNSRCEKLLNKIENGQKLSENDILTLCEQYELLPTEVDWITEKLLQHHYIDQEYHSIDEYDNPWNERVSILPIPVGMTDIPNNFFKNNHNLRNVSIPEGVKSLGKGAFWGCDKMARLTIPKSVTTIECECFEHCDALQEVVFYGDLPQDDLFLLSLFDTRLDRIVVYGNIKKGSCLRGSIEVNDPLKIILYSVPLKDCYSLFGDRIFLCEDGFVYGAINGFEFDAKVYKQNKSYISKHKKELFYYAIVKHSVPMLQYLCDRQYIPPKIYKKTIEKVFPISLRTRIETRSEVLEDYNAVFHSSQEELRNSWKFQKNSDETISIASFRGQNIDYICVPAYIDDLPVTRIMHHAFSPVRDYYNTRTKLGIPKDERYSLRHLIQYIDLPDTIKSIDDCAFEYIQELTISIPDTVESIGERAFDCCHRMTIIASKDSYAMKYALKHRIMWNESEVDNSLQSALIKEEPMKFTIVGTYAYCNDHMLQAGMNIKLIKEPDNVYDPLAIRVELEDVGVVGHIANSPRTVRKKCVSARVLYDIIGDKANATILEAYPNYAIGVLNM